MKEGVDEGAVGVACGGMDNHAMSFVEDDEVFVFVKDIERDILWNEFEGDGLGDGDTNNVTWVEGLLRLGGAVVDENMAFLDEGLQTRARMFL